jgi:hypothetical protein
MFMNMITDNYAQSITDFDKYVNKIIRQRTRYNPFRIYRICETRDATKPASDSTTDSKIQSPSSLFSPHPRPRQPPYRHHRHRHGLIICS